MKGFIINKLLHYNYLSRYLVWATDVFLSVVATLLSYLFLNYLVHINIIPGVALLFLLWSMVVSIFWTWVTKTYDGIIRHATVTELTRIIYAMMLKAISLLVISFFIFEKVGQFILAVITLDFVISVFLLMLTRTTIATFYYTVINNGGKGTLNTMIFSSEDELAVSLANYLRSAETQYNLVGFLTRNPHKNNYRMMGHKFFFIDSVENIQPIFEKYKINCLLFTGKDDLHSDDEIFNYGLKHNISMRIAPMADVSEEQASIQLRSIQIEDLLGRNEIKINLKEIDSRLKDMTVMVTGAAGSIGSELCRQLCKFHLKQLILVDFSETALYEINMELTKRYPDYSIVSIISDVRNSSRMEANIKEYRPDYIFHAAALKQVPSCEFFPMEAVKTNIIGTDNVLEAAINHNVKKVIVLSTDKAAYPINAMGMSKALMEKVAIAKGRNLRDNQTIICRTRYGNVMASRGSVIPLFCEQIAQGKPLTITNPDMTRFMMTLNDAVDLVIYAFEHGNQGDLFVQKAPAATINTLAKAIKELKHSDVPINCIGTRHGEKLYEVLVTKEEMVNAEDLGDYYRIPADNRNLNYQKYINEGNADVEHIEDYNSHNTNRLDVEGMKKLLLKLDLFKDCK